MSGQQAQSVMVDVTVPQLNATEQDGAALFAQNCASCHGRMRLAATVSARPWYMSSMNPATMAMAVSTWLPAWARAHHWNFGNMPAQPQVADAEIAKIISYIRTLQRANGIF